MELGFMTFWGKIIHYMILEGINKSCDNVRNFGIQRDFLSDLSYPF